MHRYSGSTDSDLSIARVAAVGRPRCPAVIAKKRTKTPEFGWSETRRLRQSAGFPAAATSSLVEPRRHLLV